MQVVRVRLSAKAFFSIPPPFFCLFVLFFVVVVLTIFVTCWLVSL